MPDPVAPVTPVPEPQPQPEKPNRIEQRISQLVGTVHEQTERADTNAALAQELRTQLLQAQEQVALLRAQHSAPPSSTDQSPVVSSVPGVDWRKEMAAAVKEAVGPVISGLQQDRQRQALFAAQRQSFERARSETPDLANPQSELYRTADTLLSRMPQLQSMPTGPELAVLMAKGLLGASAPQPTTEQRIAAGAAPAVSRGPTPTATPQDQIKALEAEIDKVLEQGRTTEDQAVSAQCWVKRGFLTEQIEALKKAHNIQ